MYQLMYLGTTKNVLLGAANQAMLKGNCPRVPTMVREAFNDKLQKVLRKAPSLLIDATTNIAETFMRIIVKSLGHKQVRRSKRNSH